MSSGKTSLLFRQALCCAEKGQNILFLAASPLETLPLVPETSSGSLQPPSHLLQRIHFKYPASVTELLQLLSNLHLTTSSAQSHSNNVFQSIVVDDFHKFVSSQTQVKGHSITSEVAQMCAYIIDAVDYLESQWDLYSGSAPADKEDSSHHHHHLTTAALSLSTHVYHDVKVEVIRRWFPDVVQITGSKEKDYIVTATTGVTLLRYRLSYPYLQIMPTTNTA